jgi:hypothetical protein
LTQYLVSDRIFRQFFPEKTPEIKARFAHAYPRTASVKRRWETHTPGFADGYFRHILIYIYI